MEISESLILPKLPVRPVNSNKGTFGSILLIAGSKNFPGAAILSVLAAARVGAGLVTLVTDQEVYKVAVPKIPFATFLNFSEIEKNLNNYDAVLIGPGLRIENLEFRIKNWINVKGIKKKIILDAEALNVLAEVKDWYEELGADVILTPHPGEMSRLTGLTIEEIQSKREDAALRYSKIWNKTIVLKGAKTIISNPKGEIFVSPFANPLLATAGTGDVLAGVIAGLLAQGLNLVDASITGVFIHGLAGEKLKDKFGDSGATALDLIEKIPEVIKDLKSV